MTKLNGENIDGVAFLFFSTLLISSGQINTMFRKVYPTYYNLVAAGISPVFLGYKVSGDLAGHESIFMKELWCNVPLGYQKPKRCC
ncbi:MAG: hypothetical protein MN733_04070 [Nitrososphaera sp.]|nr:hypothetical protein [Nitrososphaera sp.]